MAIPKKPRTGDQKDIVGAVRPRRNEPATRPALNGEQVAVRAYELFVQRGGQHGHDLDDWFAAERQLAEGR